MKKLGDIIIREKIKLLTTMKDKILYELEGSLNVAQTTAITLIFENKILKLKSR